MGRREGPGYLRLSQNSARGNGGTCYGDSGGPNFLGAGSTETDFIAGITITGDSLCKSTHVIYRFDTESARAPSSTTSSRCRSLVSRPPAGA
jgi:hypothetical protein